MYDKQKPKKTTAILFTISLIAVLAGILTQALGDHLALPILCYVGGIIALAFAAKINAAKNQNASEPYATQTKAGVLDPAHARTMQLYRQLADIHGIEKRTRMLAEEKAIQEEELHRLEQEKAKVGALRNSSAASPQMALKNKRSIVEGVANGLVGRSAGVSTTVDAMRQSEHDFAQSQTAIQSHTDEMEQWARDLSDQIGHMRDSIAETEQKIKDCKDKAVLETVSRDVLFDALELAAEVKIADNQSSLLLKISISNHYKADAAEIAPSASWAVDGTLDAIIYCCGEMIDVIPVALPAQGIQCVDEEEKTASETVMAYSNCCTDTDGEYTARVVPRALWLMEV